MGIYKRKILSVKVRKYTFDLENKQKKHDLVHDIDQEKKVLRFSFFFFFKTPPLNYTVDTVGKTYFFLFRTDF